MRVRANLTRIFSNRWSVSCRVCENRFEKLLYKKSREQGGEEKLENNRGDRVAVLTPFLFFLSSSLSLSSSLFDESLSRLKLMDETGNRSRGGK